MFRPSFEYSTFWVQVTSLTAWSSLFNGFFQVDYNLFKCFAKYRFNGHLSWIKILVARGTWSAECPCYVRNVSIQSSIVSDITPHTPLKVNWHFGETCRRHLHGWRLSQARNQHEAGSKQTLFNPEVAGDMVLRNVRWPFMDYRRNTSEGRFRHNQRCENLKSYICPFYTLWNVTFHLWYIAQD
jgi:hypothetical protein